LRGFPQTIEIMVTHGLFTGDEWERLGEFGVSRIFCSATVARPSRAGNERIVTLSVVSLIADTLRSRGLRVL
jgi:phosphoribosylpyrophosphate synthetase